MVFSLVLIVAIIVGYIARTSELANARDLRLQTSAQLGSVELSSIVDGVEVAALAGSDPAATASAVAALSRRIGVCVVAAGEPVCTGDGPRPDIDNTIATNTPAGVHVVVYESLLTISAVGPELEVIAQAPVDLMSPAGSAVVWATTFLPPGATVDGFVVDGGIRQTATAVAADSSLFVVAADEDKVSLPADEQRLYLIIFTLAVLLLVLAGITLFVEQRSLVERASFDPLTKLPNRSEFERRMADAIGVAERRGSGVCLLLFDLNGFKQINDTYGHNAGDDMLRVVANRLRKAVRDGDIVARWGGDEFVVVMPGIDTEEMGSRRARQLAEEIGGRTRLEGVDKPLRVKVSVGVALWPAHGADVHTLVESADQAMYEAKREGIVCRLAETVEPPPLAALPS